VGKDIAHTLESGRTQGVITPGSRIRRLTPRECLRLQGFTEGQIDKILAITSDSQAYAQAGNSVTVNVIYALGLRIKAMDDGLKAGDPA
jgi:DNA (cytosine-5)-methyltransferase 1